MTTSRSRRAARGLALASLLSATGCTYTVHLLSRPEGATVTLPDGSTRTTPDTVRFQRTSGKPQLLRVEAEGYETLFVDMQRTEGPLLRYVGAGIFQKGGREVTFLLIPVSQAPAGATAP